MQSGVHLLPDLKTESSMTMIELYCTKSWCEESPVTGSVALREGIGLADGSPP